MLFGGWFILDDTCFSYFSFVSYVFNDDMVS